MIHSMTGFGDAVAERGGIRYSVEIKSLNNRYFKPLLKLPEAATALEAEIEPILRRGLGRGSVVLTLRMRAGDDEADAAKDPAKAAARRLPTIDVEALRAYVGQLQQAGLEVREPERLLALPGVVRPAEVPAEPEADADDPGRHRAVVLELTERAVENLQAMRRREGEMLRADLLKHTAVIRENLDAVAARAGGVASQYHDRLLARVNELLAKAELEIGKEDLAKEVAVFAERSDISEEVVRLGHHVAQFELALADDAGEAVGRRLDFVTQEMLREANTIGSKANDADIAARIVTIKGAIDRLKEQVQNVE